MNSQSSQKKDHQHQHSQSQQDNSTSTSKLSNVGDDETHGKDESFFYSRIMSIISAAKQLHKSHWNRYSCEFESSTTRDSNNISSSSSSSNNSSIHRSRIIIHIEVSSKGDPLGKTVLNHICDDCVYDKMDYSWMFFDFLHCSCYPHSDHSNSNTNATHTTEFIQRTYSDDNTYSNTSSTKNHTPLPSDGDHMNTDSEEVLCESLTHACQTQQQVINYSYPMTATTTLHDTQTSGSLSGDGMRSTSTMVVEKSNRKRMRASSFDQHSDEQENEDHDNDEYSQNSNHSYFSPSKKAKLSTVAAATATIDSETGDHRFHSTLIGGGVHSPLSDTQRTMKRIESEFDSMCNLPSSSTSSEYDDSSCSS